MEIVFYGLDDLNDATEIIIVNITSPWLGCYQLIQLFISPYLIVYIFMLFKVEGEMDKLSVEEAGFGNCVSVPGGAPGKVSNKLPSLEKVGLNGIMFQSS